MVRRLSGSGRHHLLSSLRLVVFDLVTGYLDMLMTPLLPSLRMLFRGDAPLELEPSGVTWGCSSRPEL